MLSREMTIAEVAAAINADVSMRLGVTFLNSAVDATGEHWKHAQGCTFAHADEDTSPMQGLPTRCAPTCMV